MSRYLVSQSRYSAHPDSPAARQGVRGRRTANWRYFLVPSFAVAIVQLVLNNASWGSTVVLSRTYSAPYVSKSAVVTQGVAIDAINTAGKSLENAETSPASKSPATIFSAQAVTDFQCASAASDIFLAG